MKSIWSLILWFMWSLVPLDALAAPVGAVKDSSGQIVAIADIPDWGDTPSKIHRRYCDEPTTVKAVWKAVLTPSGIKDDRKMPAGEVLEVRCEKIKNAWQTAALFRGVDDGKIQALETQVRALEARLRQTEESVTVVKTSLPMRAVVVEEWTKPAVSTFVVSLLALLFLIALLVLALQSRRQEPERGTTQRTRYGRESFGAALDERVITRIDKDNEEIEVTVPVTDWRGNTRRFQYRAPRAPNGKYPLLRPDATTTGAPVYLEGEKDFAEAVQKTLKNWLVEPWKPELAEELRFIAQALKDGRLVEL